MASRLIRDHHLWTRDTIKNVSGDVTLDMAGDITLDAGGGNVYFINAGTTTMDFDTNGATSAGAGMTYK